VRLHDDPNGNGTAKNAEFAVLLRSSLKGKGLGWLLMKRIIAYAREHGIATVHGQVLAENTTMLAMCEDLGFHIADDMSERGMKYVTLKPGDVPATP
jgi:acetyltransferase